MASNLNLLYQKPNSVFFRHLKFIQKEIEQTSFSEALGTTRDIYEIKRGESYAFFENLRQKARTGEGITISDFREELSNQGINDRSFQDKILTCLLQSRYGLQFNPLNGMWPEILENYTELFAKAPEGSRSREENLKIINEHTAIFTQVKYFYDSTGLCNLKSEFSFKITPDSVALTSYNLSKLTNNSLANAAYNSLSKQQCNIFTRIITYFKRLLGFNNELVLQSNSELKEVAKIRPQDIVSSASSEHSNESTDADYDSDADLPPLVHADEPDTDISTTRTLVTATRDAIKSPTGLDEKQSPKLGTSPSKKQT